MKQHNINEIRCNRNIIEIEASQNITMGNKIEIEATQNKIEDTIFGYSF